MFKLLAAAGLAVHGLIHLIGFVVPWGIVQVDGFPYRTTALGGALAIGDAGARVVGVAWLALAIAFVVAAVAAWRGASFAAPLVAALALASIAVCALGLPDAGFGILVNVVILGLLVATTRARGRAAGAIS